MGSPIRSSSAERWSQLWSNMLHALGLMPTTQRLGGHSRIRRLEVTQGQVHADVQNRTHGLGKVTLTFSPLTPAAWQALVTLISQYLNGAVQLDAQQIFAPNAPIFSELSALLLSLSPADLTVHCSSCDDKLHCPALQAVYQQVGQMLDEDPVLLLRLRGQNWQSLTQALQQQRNHSYSTAVATSASANVTTASPSATDGAVTGEHGLDAHSSAFWGARRALLSFHHHIAPPRVELAILRRLGTLPPPLDDTTADEALATIYHHVTHEATALAYDLDTADDENGETVETDND